MELNRASAKFAKVWGLLSKSWVIAVLMLVLGSLWAGCSRGAEPAFRGGARLSVEPPAVDLGALAPGKEVSVRFTLRNEGDSPLSIEKALTRVVEGCCPPQPELSSSAIPPGKKATLSLVVKMPADMSGPHRFEVLVYSNDALSPITTLEVKGVFSGG